jgi:hypothetical protein
VIEDLPARYQEYLDRFMDQIGDVKAGAFAKYNSKLIKKLSFEEFTPAYLEYSGMLERFNESLERGDTINDAMLRILREKAAGLVMKLPAGG